MRKLLTSACFMLAMMLFAMEPALAADKAPSEKQLAQQELMTKCNEKAGDKKGDERKKFMSTCLKGKGPSEAQLAQQEKMKTCNKEAGDKKLAGEERKKFMSNCLKG